MEVRHGYKLTVVGVIPHDWRAVELNAVCFMKSGESITGGRIDDFSSYPCYGGNGLRGYTSSFTHDGKFALIGRQGALCGNVVSAQGKFFASEHAVVVAARPGTDIAYLTYVLSQMHLNRYSESSAQPGLSVSKVLKLPVAVPPIEAEQRAIAGALNDVDALLGALDRLIAKKRDLKQAAMQQLLTGQTRLPGFNSSGGFRRTDVGSFPDDWDLTPLVTLVDPGRGIRYGIVQPGEYDPHGRYMVRGQDYSEVKGWANPDEVFRVSQKIESRYRNARLKAGDIIMTIVGYCGHVEVIPEWLDGANLTQTTARIAIRSTRANSAFCKYMLLTPVGKNQVTAYMKGAAQPGLNCGDVERFLVPLPSISEQTAIATVLSGMDAELETLEQRHAKTAALKQGMMQELLTGRTRLG